MTRSRRVRGLLVGVHGDFVEGTGTAEGHGRPKLMRMMMERRGEEEAAEPNGRLELGRKAWAELRRSVECVAGGNTLHTVRD